MNPPDYRYMILLKPQSRVNRFARLGVSFRSYYRIFRRHKKTSVIEAIKASWGLAVLTLKHP